MVSEGLRHDGTRLFFCEFCGTGYRDIEIAEKCEQHCSTLGSASAMIRRKAVQIPKIQVVPTQ